MNKKNTILIIILALLIASAYLYQGPWQDWQNKKSQPQNFLAKVDIDKVNKIEVTKSGKTTTLALTAGRWKIGDTKDFYVSDAIANSLTATLKDLVKAQLEIASQNKDKKVDFNTDDTNGVIVKLKQDDNELESFVVGKITSDYTSSYISPANSDKTYLVRTLAADVFNNSDWYDKTIFASDKTKINKIRFQINGKEYTIEKSGETWSAGTTKLNNDKVASVIDLMSSLVASDIPEQKFEGTGLEKNQIIVQASGEGIDNTIVIGDNNGKDSYYAKRGNSDNIYLIAKAERDRLNVQIKDLK